MEKTTDRAIPWWAPAFVLTGVLMLVLGDADTRMVGVLSVTVFGALTLIAVAPRVRGRRRGWRIVDGGLFVPFSRVKLFLTLLGSLAMVAGGVLIALDGHPVYGSAGAAVFTLASFNGLLVLRRPSGLTLTSQGIVVDWFRRAEVAWDDVILPVEYCPLDPDAVLALLEAYRAGPARRAVIGTEAEFARVI